MNGWDRTHRIELPEPWEGFWIEVLDNPPTSVLLDLGEAVAKGQSDPRPEVIEAALAAARPYIAAHNLTGRDGKPLEWTLRAFAPSLIVAVIVAIKDDMESGAAAAPFASRSARRARSRPRSSPKPRSRPGSISGASRSA